MDLIMTYMNQEKKATIKAALDQVLKPRDIKYGLRVDNNMAITCTLKSGPIDFIGNFKEKTGDKFPGIPGRLMDHLQVNTYWINDHFSGPTADLLSLIVNALKAANYYDRSDAMADYFDTAYYFHLNIGKWKKPYKLTIPTMRQAGAAINEAALKAKILAYGCNAEFLSNKLIVKVIGS